MSARPDVDRSIAEWLEIEAADGASEHLLEAARERISVTRQRGVFIPPPRFIDVKDAFTAMAIGLAAAAAVAFVGINLLIPERGKTGGPAAPPAHGLSTTAPSAGAACRKPLPARAALLGDCIYATTSFAVPFSIHLNDRWVYVGSLSDNVVDFEAALPNEPASSLENHLTISVLDRVYDHPCHGLGVGPEPSRPYRGGGSGASGFWTWLRTNAPMVTFESPSPTTIGGVVALQATSTTKVNQISAACDGVSYVDVGDLGATERTSFGENAGAERLTTLVVGGRTLLIDVSVQPAYGVNGVPTAENAAHFPSLSAAADQALSTVEFDRP